MSLDLRFNPGTNSQILKHVALGLLKNIATHRKNKQFINKSWLDFKVLEHEEIPSAVYARLGLKAMM